MNFDKLKHLLLFTSLAILMILRRPDMLLNPQPWAEDGTQFLQDSIYLGKKAIFEPYAGYLHLAPRMITWVSLKISELSEHGIELFPLISNFLTVLLCVASVFYFSSKSFDFFAPFWQRVAAVVFIVCIPGINEVYGTATNVNWWIGVFQFLVVLHFWHKRKYSSPTIAFLFAISGLSGPMIASAIFFILLRISIDKLKKKTISFESLSWSVFSLVFATIQIAISLKMRHPSNDLHPNLTNFITLFPKTFFIGVFNRIIFYDFQNNVQYFQVATSALIGAFIAVLIYILVISKNTVVFSYSYILVLMLLNFKGAPFLFGLYKDTFVDVAQRYFLVSVAVTIILISKIIIRSSEYLKTSLYMALLIFMTISSVINYHQPKFEEFHWKLSVKNYDRSSPQSCTISINPKGFTMKIPCR